MAVQPRPVRAAVIGCGTIGPNHLAALSVDPRVQVVAVCDLLPERAARVLPLGRIETQAQRLFADPGIDLVTIATPHPSHRDLIEAALASGKHVLCEKPLTVTPADLDALIALADQARPRGQVVSGVFQHRFAPLARELHRLLVEGAFGRITGSRMEFACHRSEAYFRHDAWRGSWAGEGGGVLINQAIHTIDLWLWFAGTPRRVRGRVENRRTAAYAEVEDWAEAEVVFASGATGKLLAVNQATEAWTSAVHIQAERGRFCYTNNGGGTLLELEHPDTALVRHLRQVESTKLDLPVLPGKTCYGDLHTAQIMDVVGAIIDGRPPAITFADAATANRLVLALYHATAIGAPVDLPFAGFQRPHLISPSS